MKTIGLVAMLLTAVMLYTIQPAMAEMKGDGHGMAGMGDPKDMQAKHTMMHGMMRDMMGMMKGMMGIMKDMNHTPTPEQKKTFDDMMKRLDVMTHDMAKHHEEMMKKHDEKKEEMKHTK